MHVLTVNCVPRRIEGPETFGTGKKRALCPCCQTLQDRENFFRVFLWPNPSTSGALYYEPHWAWYCSDCLEKRQIRDNLMDEDTYQRLFNEMCEAYFAACTQEAERAV